MRSESEEETRPMTLEKPTRRPPSFVDDGQLGSEIMLELCARVARIDAESEARLEDHRAIMQAGASQSVQILELQETIGKPKNGHGSSGAGLVGLVESLHDTIGSDPNESTGKAGTGLCGTVARLVRAEQHRKSASAGGAAAGGAAIVGVIELARALIPLFAG